MAEKGEWRGKIGGLSEQEIEEFLAGDPICRLGCLDDDGWPYVVPVWYEYSDGGFYIIPRARALWAKYIERDPRVYLCMDVWETMRKVMFKGKAEIVETPNVGGKWVDICNRMAVRYLGENGPKYVEPTLPEPRWLLFVKPQEKMVTWQGVDWAKRYKHV